MIPYQRNQRLTDREIAVALTVKTLSLGAPGERCIACGKDNTIEHDQQCMMKTHHRTHRHNRLVREALASAVKSKPNTRTEFECTLPKTLPQDPTLIIDIRVRGPGAINTVGTDGDVSVTSVTNRDSRHLLLQWLEDTEKAVLQLTNPTKFAEEYIREVLARRARLKDDKYAGKSDFPFIPLIITSGGWLHERWIKWMKDLQPELKLKRLYQTIGVILLQTRAVNFRMDY